MHLQTNQHIMECKFVAGTTCNIYWAKRFLTEIWNIYRKTFDIYYREIEGNFLASFIYEVIAKFKISFFIGYHTQ